MKLTYYTGVMADDNLRKSWSSCVDYTQEIPDVTEHSLQYFKLVIPLPFLSGGLRFLS